MTLQEWDISTGGGGSTVKSGTVTGNTDTWLSVSFNTAFSSAPIVVVTADANTTARWDFTPIIRSVTVNGFDVRYDDRGQAGTVVVNWMAMEPSNP